MYLMFRTNTSNLNIIQVTYALTFAIGHEIIEVIQFNR